LTFKVEKKSAHAGATQKYPDKVVILPLLAFGVKTVADRHMCVF